MSDCTNCNEITLFTGNDGIGIVSITENGDGTITILFSDGTTWTSSSLIGPEGPAGPQGPQGSPGLQGEDGSNVIFSFIGPFINVETPNIVAPINPTWFVNNGDTLLLTYKFSMQPLDTLMLNANRVSGSTAYTLYTNSGTGRITGTLDIVLIKSGNSFIGNLRVLGVYVPANTSFIIFNDDLTLTNFLLDPISIELYGFSAPGDLSIKNVVIQRIKTI